MSDLQETKILTLIWCDRFALLVFMHQNVTICISLWNNLSGMSSHCFMLLNQIYLIMQMCLYALLCDALKKD